jgi:hypothetical protein
VNTNPSKKVNIMFTGMPFSLTAPTPRNMRYNPKRLLKWLILFLITLSTFCSSGIIVIADFLPSWCVFSLKLFYHMGRKSAAFIGFCYLLSLSLVWES